MKWRSFKKKFVENVKRCQRIYFQLTIIIIKVLKFKRVYIEI